MALEPRRYDRILNEAPDDVLGAIFGLGLKPMAQRGTGLPGLRGEGLEILGAFANRVAPPPPWADPSSPETPVDGVPGPEEF